jgi:hypothetical protein
MGHINTMLVEKLLDSLKPSDFKKHIFEKQEASAFRHGVVHYNI